MITVSSGKSFLTFACILAFIQGLIFLIGGTLSTRDSNKSLNGSSSPDNTFHFLSASIADAKYSCGDLRLRRIPGNIGAAGEKCDADYGEMDRGWFRRVHEYCKEGSGKVCELNGYKYVLALSVTCGVGCVLSALVGLLAVILVSKTLGQIAGGMLVVFYLIFVVLFTLIWDSVQDFSDSCLEKACEKVKSRGRRSSVEVLAYSVCAFVLVFGAIFCAFLGSLGLDEETYVPNTRYSSAKVVGISDDANMEKANEAATEYNREEGKSNVHSGPANKELVKKFKKLNKYITGKKKMRKCADKKFDKATEDGAKALSSKDFRELVEKIVSKKKLPAPSDAKIDEVLRNYKKSNESVIEKDEFEQMLFEIFLESREILIMKYAEEKASSWKQRKKPKDTSRLPDLDKLLGNSSNFYKILKEVVEKTGKSEETMFSIDEVTKVLSIFCDEYYILAPGADDIIEVMADMERFITEYDLNDLRMAAYAVLSISRNMIK